MRPLSGRHQQQQNKQDFNSARKLIEIWRSDQLICFYVKNGFKFDNLKLIRQELTAITLIQEETNYSQIKEQQKKLQLYSNSHFIVSYQ